MSAPLVSIRKSQLTESGLFKGTHALDCPLWIDGQNVLFRNGGPEKIGGWTSVFSVTGAGVIRGMDALQDEASVQRLFFGDEGKLYMWAAGTVSTLGTGFTGYTDESVTHPATCWSFTRFGNWSLATNGKDASQIYKGTAFAEMTGLTFDTAEIFLRRGPHILAFNLSGNAGGNGKSTYGWSDEDNPETWTPTSENAAGDQPIRDMDGEIKAAVPFGESIAVLGKNQMYVVQYSGAPFYFPYQPGPAGIGAVGKMAVVSVNRMLYGMSEQGIWQSDGVTYQYIDTLALRDYIDGVLDRDNLSKVAATYDASTETVLWSLPTAATGENTVTVSYRIPNQSWSVCTFGRSCWVPQLGVFSQPVGAGTDAQVYFHNEDRDADGAAIDAWVRTKPFAPQDARAWTYLDAISVQLRQMTGAVQVRVGSQKNLDDAISWTDYRTLDDGFEKLNLRKSGRFLSLEVRSNTLGGRFAMSGFDAYGTTGGRI